MNEVINRLIGRYPALKPAVNDIEAACDAIVCCYRGGGKLLLCGNGGSAADCEHIAGELLKGFTRKRPLVGREREKLLQGGATESFCDNLQGSLAALALTGHTAFATAYGNDVNPCFVFAQQLYGLGNENDVLLAISTSGNSENVCNAVVVAKGMNIKTIALTGASQNRLTALCGITIKVPEEETYKIQEYHLPIYHAICEAVEKSFFDA